MTIIQKTKNYIYKYDVVYKDDIYNCEVEVNETVLSDISEILEIYGAYKIQEAFISKEEAKNTAVLNEFF